MTKARHDAEIRLTQYNAEQAINREYQRAMKDGRAKVHAWAIDSNYQMFSVDSTRAKSAAIMAFQEAERQFRPAPTTITEALNG